MEAEHEMPPLLEKVFRGNIQFVRVEERSKVHLRGGDDGTVYHHLTPTCGPEKWRAGGVKATKWCEVEREQRNIWTERDRGRKRRREKGRREGGKGGGKDKLKEQGERFSIPPLTALRLSLAVLIHGFSGL